MALAEQGLHHPISFPSALTDVFNALAQTCAVDAEVDAENIKCPMPLLKTKQALRNLQSKQRLRVRATDAGTLKDFVAFMQLTKNSIVYFYTHQQTYIYVFEKSAA